MYILINIDIYVQYIRKYHDIIFRSYRSALEYVVLRFCSVSYIYSVIHWYRHRCTLVHGEKAGLQCRVVAEANVLLGVLHCLCSPLWSFFLPHCNASQAHSHHRAFFTSRPPQELQLALLVHQCPHSPPILAYHTDEHAGTSKRSLPPCAHAGWWQVLDTRLLYSTSLPSLIHPTITDCSVTEQAESCWENKSRQVCIQSVFISAFSGIYLMDSSFK